MQENISSLPDLTRIRGFILDMDGVIWRGDQPLGDLPWIFEAIRRHGLKVVLATNNATRTPEQYVERLASYGVHVERWQVVNSAQAAAHYLKARFPEGGQVYVIGEHGVIEALQEQGFHVAENGVKAVVVAMDRKLSYDKLTRATLLIRAGAPFIGTNPDRTFPTPDGLIPGAGALLAAIETATDIKPVIVGKPAPEMYKVALERMGLLPEETMVVGDRLETDIAGAQPLGCPTTLVLSGVTTELAARQWHPAPSVIAPNLTALIEGMIRQRQP